MPSTIEIVPTGPYFGFTRREILDELERYKAQVKGAGSTLASSNINGQMLTFGPRGDWSLTDWQWNIQAALALIAPGEFPYPVVTNSAVIVSR